MLKTSSLIRSAETRMKRRQSRTIRKSRRLALKRKRIKHRSSIGEIMMVTPSKTKSKNSTVAERAAEQLAEAAAALHDAQTDRKNSGGKQKTTKAKKVKGSKKKGNKGKKAKGPGRRPRISFHGFVDEEKPARESMVRLFDGSHSGGSTPLAESSEEEPNTEDNEFLVDENEVLSDPDYIPTDEEAEELNESIRDPDEETKHGNTPEGGDWVEGGGAEMVWVPEEKPEGDPFDGLFNDMDIELGGGPPAVHTPRKEPPPKEHKEAESSTEREASDPVTAPPSGL